MNRRRVIAVLVCLVLIIPTIALAYALLVYTDPPVDPAWELVASDDIPDDAVTVRFSGTSTLLFSDGQTQWMTDGWFTRPGPLRLLLGKIGPDLVAIEQGLADNKIETLAAVLPLHSHYDHAMDAPEVARRTGALLLGSQSTANIGRGWGLPEAQIKVLVDRQPVQLGRFVITPIESRHFQFPDAMMRERALDNPQLVAPLVPPVSAFDYRLGKAYVLHVRHPRGSWLSGGSAGYREGALRGLQADVVFLGVGGLGSQTASYRESFWRETVAAVSPQRLIPIHYDSLTAPVEGAFRGPVKALGFLSGGLENTLQFLRDKESDQPQLLINTLPRFDEVVLFK